MRFLPRSADFVLGFFVCLCAFSVLAIGILSIEQSKRDTTQTNITRFNALDFEYFKITQEGVSTIVKGASVKENTNNEDELTKIFVQNLAKDSTIEHLNADFAIYNTMHVFFPQGVHFTRDSTKLWSEKARYYPNSKELEGSGAFIIVDKDNTIHGKNLVYKDNKIYAQNIRGILKEK